VILYTSNGEARKELSIVLTARVVSAQPTPSSESSEVRWGAESQLPGYTMDRSMCIRISDFLARNESPVITQSRVLAGNTGLHRRPVLGSATLAPRISRSRIGPREPKREPAA
jgi:hypothetical protein